MSAKARELKIKSLMSLRTFNRFTERKLDEPKVQIYLVLFALGVTLPRFIYVWGWSF